MKIDYRQLYDELTAYNEKVNLTAIEGYENYMIKHIEDSRAGLPYISGKVLDIGSGAGFPGLVIKNELPETDVTLIDSVRKKVDYLNYIIARFGLTGIRAIHTRVEDLKERNFDCVTARAVAPLVTLAEYALPFVKKGGLFVAYKSSSCEEEVNDARYAVKFLGGTLEKIVKVPLTDDITRSILLIRKTSATPAGYPRGGNKARLTPLMSPTRHQRS